MRFQLILLLFTPVVVAQGQERPLVGQPSAQRSVAAPVVIAHRGASGYLPEHTLESASMAHAMGADFIEQDVVLSRDGVAVVLHDITLDSVTNVAEVFPDRKADDGRYYAADFSYSELQELAVTERRRFKRRDMTTRFPAGVGSFRIATLSEHLTLIKGLNQSRRMNVGAYVEIKRPGWHRKRNLDPSKVVLQTLSDHGFDDVTNHVFVQCFEFDELRRIRVELGCELPLIQLVSDRPTNSQLSEMSRVVDGIGASTKCLIATNHETDEPEILDFVEQCHRDSLIVHAWTFRSDDLPLWAETPDDALDVYVRKCGVDGLFSDQPDVVIAWRGQVLAEGPTTGPFHLLNERPHPQEDPDLRSPE